MGTYEESPPGGGNGNLNFQLRDLWRWREKFLSDHEEWRRAVDADRGELRHLIEHVDALTKSVDGLRRTILGFALSVAGSAVVFAFSILVATGKL